MALAPAHEAGKPSDAVRPSSILEGLIDLGEEGPLAYDTLVDRFPALAAPEPGGRGSRALWAISIAASVLGILLLSVIIYVATDKGQVRIVVNDPKVVVHIDGEQVRVDGLDRPLTLRTGPHRLEIKDRDITTDARTFVVKRGELEVIRVEWKPDSERADITTGPASEVREVNEVERPESGRPPRTTARARPLGPPNRIGEPEGAEIDGSKSFKPGNLVARNSPAGNFDQRQISLALAKRPTVRTLSLGGDGGYPFVEIPEPRGLLVGVRVTTGHYGSWTVIESIQPMILTSRGREWSSVCGRPNGPHSDHLPPLLVVAKEGYAVGSFEVPSGDLIDNFKVKLMKIKSDFELNDKEIYESEWVGGRGMGGQPIRILGGAGRPIVGLYGRSADLLDGLGLIQGAQK